jgi:starvation-inducible DNA-binding protein
MKNQIGLDRKRSEEIIELLNALLSDYQVYYQNLRGFHWNVKGNKFFELHQKFEEWYEDAVMKIDEIAERILTLGGTPLHTFEDYLKTSGIQAVRSDRVGEEAVRIVMENMGILISKERLVLSLAAESGDEGTISQMSEYITLMEKTIWMLDAYLS